MGNPLWLLPGLLLGAGEEGTSPQVSVPTATQVSIPVNNIVTSGSVVPTYPAPHAGQLRTGWGPGCEEPPGAPATLSPEQLTVHSKAAIPSLAGGFV